jgi:hypothetical protein
MRLRLLLPLLIVLAVSLGAVWAKYLRPSAALAVAGTASTPADAGPHMRMTAAREARAGDEARAAEIAAGARRAIEKYRDYRAALGDGYEILQSQVPQKMYHFNNLSYYGEAERRFSVEHPTSLLYEKSGAGYRLIGVMYTAPARLTEEELDERIPLSVATWHQHVNVCLPPGDPLRHLFGGDPRYGLEGSISAEEGCREAGGRFYPRLFGWMVHLYPYERTPQEMWSVERQMAGGPGHVH